MSVATTENSSGATATTASVRRRTQAQQLGVDDAGHRAPPCTMRQVAVLERRAQRAQLDQHDPGVEGGPVDARRPGRRRRRRRRRRPAGGRRARSTPWPCATSSARSASRSLGPAAGTTARPPATPSSSSRGGALVERPAGVDEDQPVAHLLELAEVVGRHQHGAARAGQRADQRPHLAHALGVEAVGRLVEDQQVGVAEQRGGDAEPLLHAQRVAAVAVVAPVRRGRPGRAAPGCVGGSWPPTVANTRRFSAPVSDG